MLAYLFFLDYTDHTVLKGGKLVKNRLQKEKNTSKILIICAILFSVVLYFSIGAKVFADEYKYDENDRIIEVIHDDGSATIYEYDANGNIVSTLYFESKESAEDYLSQNPDDSQDDNNDDTVTDGSDGNNTSDDKGDDKKSDNKDKTDTEDTTSKDSSHDSGQQNSNDENNKKNSTKTDNSASGSSDITDENHGDNGDNISSDNNNSEGSGRVIVDNDAELVESSGNSAKTGDSSPLFTLTLIMALSATAIIGLMIFKRKRKDK